jgi:hypothetical protein
MSLATKLRERASAELDDIEEKLSRWARNLLRKGCSPRMHFAFTLINHAWLLMRGSVVSRSGADD